MSKNLMLDYETLAVSPDAVILTLGAVHFDPYSDSITDHLYLRVELEEQERLGRKIDPNVLDWWSKQDPEIVDEAFDLKDRVSLSDAMDLFHKFAWGCDAFWSHGSVFDLVITENILTQLNKPFPWSYWQLRDTRTLFSLGIDPQMPNANKHNALEDAIRQAVGVQNVYSALGLKPT